MRQHVGGKKAVGVEKKGNQDTDQEQEKSEDDI